MSQTITIEITVRASPAIALADLLDAFVRSDVVQIPVGGGQGAVAELAGDHVQAHALGQ